MTRHTTCVSQKKTLPREANILDPTLMKSVVISQWLERFGIQVDAANIAGFFAMFDKSNGSDMYP